MEKQKRDKINSILEDFYSRRLDGEEVKVNDMIQANPDFSDILDKNSKVIESVLKYIEPPEPEAEGFSDEPFPEIPGFEIIERLGSGMFGEVYRAKDVRLDRMVALKVIRTALLKDALFLERFFNEARALAKLKHTHIVTIYSEGDTEGLSYLCMELIEGITLAEFIEKKGALPVYEALRIARDISSALIAIHNAGLVHRDIKSSNVMLDKSGTAKLMDFGIARFQKLDLKLTQDGHLVGTPYYMSPEQFQGAKIDERSDLFSMGVLLYEMLTGEMPFQGTRVEEVRHAVLHEDPVPIGKYCADLPCNVILILERLLLKDSSQRYQSAAELEAALSRAIVERPLESSKSLAKTQEKDKTPLWILARPRRLVAGIVLILALTVGAYFLKGVIFPEPPVPFIASAQFVVLRDGDPGDPEVIFNDTELKNKDQIQLLWKANKPAYIYVWNKCPEEQGKTYTLFPHPESALSNPVSEEESEIILPGQYREGGKDELLTWTLEEPGGEQIFNIIASRERLPGIEAMLNLAETPPLRPFDEEEKELEGAGDLAKKESPDKSEFEKPGEDEKTKGEQKVRPRGVKSLGVIRKPWRRRQEANKDGVIAWTLTFYQKK